MPKQTRIIDYRVVVTPEHSYSNDQLLAHYESCARIAEDIKRHVDGFSTIEIEVEKEEVCSSCGARWTETSSIYNGGCCDKDEENDPNEPDDIH